MLPELLEGTPLYDVDPDAALTASAQVRGACGWHIAPLLTEDVVLPWARSGRYLLPSMHVVSVNTVKINGAAVAFDWAPDGELHLSPWTRPLPSINGPGLWCAGLRSVAVNFTHGYDECPEDVRQAVVIRAARLGMGRSQTQSAGPFSVTSTFDSDPDADLAAYRLPSIG